MSRRSLGRLLALYEHGGRRQRCTAAAAQAPPASLRSLVFGKSEERRIPSPWGVPMLSSIASIAWHGGSAKIHEYVDMRHKQLGPIFRDNLGTVDAVMLADQDLISSVLSNSHHHPKHMVPEPWLIYNKLRGITRGLFFMNGEEWCEKRQILNNPMQGKDALKGSESAVLEIVQDLLQRWNKLSSANGGIVPDLETELYNWSIETLGSIVFARRLGCVAQPGEVNEMQKFVYYVQKIFRETAKMSLIPPKLAYYLRLPVWRSFEEAADNALEIARQCTELRISELPVQELKEKYNEELKKKYDKELREKYGVIGNLMAAGNITNEDIVNIVADLIIAAADTTSHATQWALYSLAQNPECQEKLYNEIKTVTKGKPLTHEHIAEIPYLNLVIKETLRLYPIAPFLTRIFEDDINVGGYIIPAKKLVLMSQFTMGRNPESFKNPDKFIPDRWERSCRGRGDEHRNLAKGCMPFGSGARACVGKKTAELKMKVILGKLVQLYRLESVNTVDIALRMITTPDRPIQIRLQRRQS